jgi:hypothetical protein
MIHIPGYHNEASQNGARADQRIFEVHDESPMSEPVDVFTREISDGSVDRDGFEVIEEMLRRPLLMRMAACEDFRPGHRRDGRNRLLDQPIQALPIGLDPPEKADDKIRVEEIGHPVTRLLAGR